MNVKTMTEDRLKAAISVSKMCQTSRHEQEPILLACSQGNVPCPAETAQRSPLLQRLPMAEDNLKAREMGIGVSGGYVIFYERGEAG